MTSKVYTIEARAYDIVGVGAHDFWVLRDENKKVLAELHGLATDPKKPTEPKTIGTINDKLSFFHYGSLAIDLGLNPKLNTTYIQPNQDSKTIFSGTLDEAYARWDSAVKAIPYLNSLNVPYTTLAIFGSNPVNSNTAYALFGNIMDIPVHDFSWYWEPGWGNTAQILPPEKLETLRYHPIVSGVTTNLFTATVTDPLGLRAAGNPDPTDAISIDNILMDTGGYTVTGYGDVNADSGVAAFINDTVTGGYRPGEQNLNTNFLSAAWNSVSNFVTNTIPNAISAVGSFVSNAINNVGNWFGSLVPTDPLVLDLDGDGVHLTDYGSAPVLFDIDHDGGSKEQTGWVSAADGIVVYDLDGNGRIDGIHETLSEYFNGAAGTNGSAGEKKYANGLAALKSLDSPVGWVAVFLATQHFAGGWRVAT